MKVFLQKCLNCLKECVPFHVSHDINYNVDMSEEFSDWEVVSVFALVFHVSNNSIDIGDVQISQVPCLTVAEAAHVIEIVGQFVKRLGLMERVEDSLSMLETHVVNKVIDEI